MDCFLPPVARPCSYGPNDPKHVQPIINRIVDTWQMKGGGRIYAQGPQETRQCHGWIQLRASPEEKTAATLPLFLFLIGCKYPFAWIRRPRPFERRSVPLLRWTPLFPTIHTLKETEKRACCFHSLLSTSYLSIELCGSEETMFSRAISSRSQFSSLYTINFPGSSSLHFQMF